MENMEEYTTIRISKKNKKKLDELGKKTDTHDDILCRLIEAVENNSIDVNDNKNSKVKKRGKAWQNNDAGLQEFCQ